MNEDLEVEVIYEGFPCIPHHPTGGPVMNDLDWNAVLKGGGFTLIHSNKKYYICEAVGCDHYATMIWRRGIVMWLCGKHFMIRQKLWATTHLLHP